MLLSIALILMLGMLSGWICKKLHLPSLLGMILTGMMLGPYTLDFMDESILMIAPELRKIALIIILTRAGLSLDLSDLKKVGRPAILMCFIPACCELLGMLILAPKLLGVSTLEAAIMGAVVGAVSPAVIVPKMLKLMKEGYGVRKSIPQLILAGASVDDVFVIVMFTAFMGLAQGESVSVVNFINIPIAIVTGILIGGIVGLTLAKYFEKIHIRDTVKVMILLCVSFILITVEDSFGTIIPFAALIAVMGVGIALRKRKEVLAKRLSLKFNKVWVAAEVLLFVLVGATVNLDYVKDTGITAILLIVGVILCRIIGVVLCLFKTNLTKKEKLFCMIGYAPKATVQAAIGGIPLAMGLACGNIVLTIAVLSILITAPVGAFLIDFSYKKLLSKE